MVKWISKISWGKVLLIGLIYTVIGMVAHQVELLWTMKYYLMPQYSGVWSRLMMPTAGPPPTEFMIVSTIMTFTTGISIAIIYNYLMEYLPKGYWKRATYFADLMASASLVLFTFPVYLLFNVPLGLLGYWFASTFVIFVLTSFAIVKILK